MLNFSPSALKTSGSPSDRLKIRRVVIRGAPFHNPKTVRDLLVQCVPKLTEEDAERVIEKATQSPDKDTTVIVCLEKDATQYCRNLVDNGLESDIS